MTVLVIEDNPDLLKTEADILRDHGFDVVCAQNGEQAMTAVRVNPSIRLIVLDLLMPATNGWQFLQELRSVVRTSEVPVVVVTASGETAMNLHGQGVSAVIQKPFDLDKFLATVRRFVA